jgi:F-type H+-transporting ATPase subunit gamma
LNVAVSSDRGLCGGIHSSVSKSVKKFVRENASAKIAIIGQKAKPQIAREAKNNIAMTFDQVAKVAPTWDECALISGTPTLYI